MSTTPRRFTLHQCLGRGSFGEVYAASMRSAGGLDTTVAVKLLRTDVDLKGEAVLRLADEGRLLARLHHPAIVRVYDLIRLDGRLALVTELIEGEDLTDAIQRSPRIPERALLQVVSQIAGALAAALTTEGPDGPLRLVHRDVKPSNIRLERHGQAKLLDFGVARFDASDREVRTASDRVMGSVPFMAPERFIERDVNPSSDVFSLGCTLYEGLSGRRFYGDNRVAAITAMALKPERYQAHLRIQLEQASMKVEVRTVLAGMLHLLPDQRPTAAECARILEELAEHVPGPTLRMWCRDRSWGQGAPLHGALFGQVMFEGDLVPPGFEAAEPEAKGPKVNLRAMSTIAPKDTEGSAVAQQDSALEQSFIAEREAPAPEVPKDLPTLVPGDQNGVSVDSTLEIPDLDPGETTTVVRLPVEQHPQNLPKIPAKKRPVPVVDEGVDGPWIGAMVFVGFSTAVAVALVVGFVAGFLVFKALMTTQ